MTQDHSDLFGASAGPEIVRQVTIRVLSERIRLLGRDRSGAYEHYSLLLERGFPIPRYEIEIVNLIRRRLPNLRSYHEIGSGLGTLPLMLAYEGVASLGVERDDRRHLTATTILRELSAQAPHVESNCRLIGASFPDAVADLDVTESMGILTDFVSSQSPQEYFKMGRMLGQYRYVLLDLMRFCQKRETAEEQAQLIEELAQNGLSPCEDTIDLQSEGHYRLFERIGPPVAVDERGPQLVAAPLGGPRTVAAAEPNPVQDAQVPVSVGRGELVPVPVGEVPATVEQSDMGRSLSGVFLPPLPGNAKKSRFGGGLTLSAFLVIGIPTILAIVYFGFVASKQYITNFQFAVRGASQAATPGTIHGAVTGVGAMSPDAFIVTDYINSSQAVNDVAPHLDVRAMFAKPGADFWARLPTEVTAEQLSAYWSRMVSAHFDLISGNVSVSVRAFTPEESLKLAQTLITTSNDIFRHLNLQAQEDFVRISEGNVRSAEQQLAKVRQELLAFREKSGLLDLDKTSQAGAAIVDDLRKQLAGFQAQYASVKGASPNSPTLSSLSAQISALENQIRNADRIDVSSAVKAVTAETLGQYQKLDLNRQFAEKEYTEALALRTQAYITAQSQLSYLALYVQPTLAQTSLYPERVKSIATVFFATVALWFIGMLVTYTVRDHML